MYFPSLTTILLGLGIAYVGHSVWTMFDLFYPTPCDPNVSSCIKPFLARNPKLELSMFTSPRGKGATSSSMDLVWKFDNFTVGAKEQRNFNISLPKKTRNNGTFFVHIFLYPQGESPFGNSRSVYQFSPLTQYSVPEAESFNLLGDNNKTNSGLSPDVPITHWKTKLAVNVMEETLLLDRYSVPGDLYRLIRLSPEGDYLPLLYIDELGQRLKDLKPVSKESRQMTLEVTYSPISVGRLRLYTNLQQSIQHLHTMGFTEKDTDELVGIFADTNFYFLAATVAVSMLHLLFDFLAFKNDISFWRNKDTMEGLSTRAVVWRCVSQIIIFLYLMDEQTSLLVLIPTGIGTLIEIWKVKKAFKVTITWNGRKPSFQLGAVSKKEQETAEFDSKAMQYLSYVLYPLCVAGAIYSLLYTPHKSWYSWVVRNLVNGVYAFGFLFMLPQLFVNYKLKSVAHLPWRAFMYKAFNTFIDDIFAFIITMPTAHRMACFRDDVVFGIYLYQRWLYPVDKTRVNEYGQSFTEDEKKTN
ncbi:lipid scramblase CLPTM1L-like [Branchiostoma lanceolatum]|uniref:lipid scramblase CLPTM1L-like n=1 Tax=Branchiostoma lanceolatum TaxID=7740 RepID=UPI0034550D19